MSAQLGNLQCHPWESPHPGTSSGSSIETTCSSSAMSQSSFWLASIQQADCLKLFGMTHMQHRYHRYFKNTSYYSNNSGLEKYLMLLDLKILTIIFLEELIFIQFKEKQSRQMKEIGEILQPFFFPTPKSRCIFISWSGAKLLSIRTPLHFIDPFHLYLTELHIL